MRQPCDVILSGGTVIDGTGAERRQADVVVRGDRIVGVGNASEWDGPRVDVSGLIVAPGFVDIHSHSDMCVFTDPRCMSKLMDGVTTELCGHCGWSPFPVHGALREHRRKSAAKSGVDLNWSDAASFLDRVDSAASAIHHAYVVGQGTLRADVIGYENRPASQDELAEMQASVEEAIRAGAFGVSSGLIYAPGCFASREEIAAVVKPAGEAGGLYATHMRSEGANIEDAIEEALYISEFSGAALEIAHLKLAGKRNWHKIGWLLERLDKARRDGLRLTCDRYSYTASSTGLDSIFPRWLYEGGSAKEVQRLKDETVLKRLRTELGDDLEDPDFWRGIFISDTGAKEHRPFVGKNVLEISEVMGTQPFDAVVELLVAANTNVSIVAFTMKEENLLAIMSQPYVFVASDATARAVDGPSSHSHPHPRGFGTFSRAIAYFVREKGILTLEEMIRKMTSGPADKIGLTDRGRIAEGAFADIVVFDESLVRDRATFENPHQYSAGIRHVLVNGRFAVRDGEFQNVYAGQLLRKR